MRASVCWLVIVVGQLGCQGAPDLAAQSNVHSILDGVADTAHPGVVAIENPFEALSGFVIAPDLVLTARHGVGEVIHPRSPCVDVNGGDIAEAAAPYAATKFRVYTSDDVFARPGTPLNVAEVLLPSAATALCGNDVALLRLASSLDPALAIAPRLEGPPLEGESVTVVGYGAAAGGTDTTSGKRRVRDDVSVAAIGPQLPRYLESEWTISEGPCAGDSGSPAFGADGRAIGVMSRGNKATCADMIYERVDTHAAWLRQEARASYLRAGLEVPAWIEPPLQGEPDGGAMSPPTDAGGCRVDPLSGPSTEGAAFVVLVAMTLVRRRRVEPR